MKHFSHSKKFISLLLSVAVAMTMTLSTVMTPLAAASVSDLRQKLQEQQAALEKVNQQLKETQSDKADAQALKTQLEQQKSLLLSQIGTLTEQIGGLDNDIVNKQDEINQKQQEVDQKQAEYDQRWADFKNRMRAMQRLNDGGSIALLSSATNLYQLLTFATTLEQIVSKDEEICQQLEDEHTQLEQQRAELEQAKADLEATKADYEAQKAALNSKTSELAENIFKAEQEGGTQGVSSESISKAEAEEQALKEAQIEANKKVDEAAKELDAALNAANQAYGNASIQCSLDFGRPLATYKYISCYFGGNGHRGTDYAAPGGTEIYAVSGGVVTAAAYHYSWGYYVQVYHGKDDNGNSYSTLYAHMKSCAVQVGQTVTAGQVIGYLGHTGNTTGNACHFEMQVNGVLTEPRYFTAYTGSDAAELTQEKADEILAEAVLRAASDQTTAVDGAAALSGVDLFTLPVVPPPQVSGYAPESGHSGIDFAAEEGAGVYAVAGGIVTAADYDVEKGNYVVLDHGGGLETEYQHMKSLLVSAGQSVAQCQILGYVGSTGNSTGPHLHFEARQDGAPADLTGTALLAE